MLDISGQTRLAALYADPATHSFSPLMQTTAFQAAGMDAVYLSFEVKKDQFPQAIEAIRTLNLLGVNISMPYKKAALAYVDQLDQAAQLIGALNTIVNHDGKLIGYNTDGIGFMKSMAENGLQLVGQEITLLGAGGAARAVLVQAALDSVRKINVFNRKSSSYTKMAELIQQLSQETSCEIQLNDLNDPHCLAEKIATSSLLINATSIGMLTAETPIPEALLRSDLAVADLIYQPAKTKLLQAAEQTGALAINGLGMLFHQGAEAFKLWTEKEMPQAARKVLIDQIKMKE